MTNPVDTYSDTVHTARKYYNTSDADAFYATIWRGENIHIGLYVEEDDSILAASRRCSAHLSERLGTLNTSHHVLDLGSFQWFHSSDPVSYTHLTLPTKA